MLTNFSKWLIYVASYFPIYAILIIRLLFSTQPDSETLIQKIQLNVCQYFYILFALTILFLLSIPTLGKIKHLRANERIYSKLKKNCTGEMASFFIPFRNRLVWLDNLFIYICHMWIFCNSIRLGAYMSCFFLSQISLVLHK